MLLRVLQNHYLVPRIHMLTTYMLYAGTQVHLQTVSLKIYCVYHCCSYPLAKYCEDFVTTVVLDNDILSRWVIPGYG